VAVSDVGKDCQLYTARQGNIRRKPDWGPVLAAWVRLQLQGEMESLVPGDNLADRGMCGAYLVEGMFDDHLAICVRYAGKQVPYRSVSLLVDILLLLGDGLRLSGCCASGQLLLMVIPEGGTGLLHDGLPNVVARSVEMGAESLGDAVTGGLGGGTGQSQGQSQDGLATRTNRDDEYHCASLAGELLARRRQSGVPNRNELKPGRGLLFLGELRVLGETISFWTRPKRSVKRRSIPIIPRTRAFSSCPCFR